MLGEPNKEFKTAMKGSLDSLMVLPGKTPDDAEQLQSIRKNLGDALWRWAQSLDHAKRIAGHIATSARFRPSPADIQETADALPDKTQLADANGDCPICHGRGFRHFVRRVRAGVFEYDADFSAICACRRGGQA